MDNSRYIIVNPETNAVTLSGRLARDLDIRRAEAGIAAVTVFYNPDEDLYGLIRVSAYAQQRMFASVVSYNPVTRHFGFVLGGLHDQLTVAGLLDHYGIEDMSSRRIEVFRKGRGANRFMYLKLSRDAQ